MASNVALTIAGLAGTAQTLIFQSPNSPAYQEASQLVGLVSESVQSGSLVAALPGTTPTIPTGSSAMLQVGVGGQYAIPVGYSALIDTASTSTTVFGGSGNGQLVMAGTGGLAYNAGQGAGTVIAGDGANYVRGRARRILPPGSGMIRLLRRLATIQSKPGRGATSSLRKVVAIPSSPLAMT